MEITLSETLNRIQSLCGGLNQHMAEARLHPESWSISQILEHLAVVERSSMIGIKRALAQTESDSEALAQTNIKLALISELLTSRVVKLQSPERVLPSGRFGPWPAPFTAFEEAGNTFIVFASQADVRFDRRVLPPPALGPLTLRQWFPFTAAHTFRHALQIEEILLAK
mgnify:CR=1 FL=1